MNTIKTHKNIRENKLIMIVSGIKLILILTKLVKTLEMIVFRKSNNPKFKILEIYFPVAVVLRSSFKVASNQEGFTSKTNNQG